MQVISGIDGLKDFAGREVGVGPWMRIDQERVNRFAEVTGDYQWIHVDPERAADSPFGGTIVHGYLTLSMLPAMIADMVRFDGMRTSINQGLNRLRFMAPVPVGSRIRLRLAIQDVRKVPVGARVTLNAVIELEGSAKPACIAEPVVLFLT
jgi:acyl dehydratase